MVQIIFGWWLHIYNFNSARFSVNMSYYGISYSIPNLSGDRYLNFMIGGGIELGAYLLAYVVLNGIGRKYPLMVSTLNSCHDVTLINVIYLSRYTFFSAAYSASEQ